MKKFKNTVSVFIAIALIATLIPMVNVQIFAANDVTIYEAESTAGLSVSREVLSDRIVCDRDVQEYNYALFTPGQTIEAGHYRILIFANLLNEPLRPEESILVFDIYGNRGSGMEVMYPAAVLRFQFQELNKFQPVQIEFTTPDVLTDAQLRFRFEKNASIEIDRFVLLKDNQYYANIEAETLGTQLPASSRKEGGIMATKEESGQKLATWGWGGTVPAGDMKVVLHMKLVERTGNPDSTVSAFQFGAASGTPPATVWLKEWMFPELNKYYAIEFPFTLTSPITGVEPYLWAALSSPQNVTYMLDRVEVVQAAINTQVLSGSISIYEAEIGPSQANTRTMTSDGQAVQCDPAVNDAGFFAFGSNLTFAPGTYKITALMKTLQRSANPSDLVAGWDTYYNVNGSAEVSNISEIRDGQFAQLDTWTPIDLYFKTATTLSGTQIRMKSYDNVKFQVDKFIINKLKDNASLVVQAESINGSLTGSYTTEGIQCEEGVNSPNWMTYGTRIALDAGNYNILAYVKQTRSTQNAQSPVITLNMSYEKGGVAYNTGFEKIFTQGQFPSVTGEYKAFSIRVNVPEGERFTASQLMVKYEGNSDIVVDRFEILPAPSFGTNLVSKNLVITNLAPGTLVSGLKSVIIPTTASVSCVKADTEKVGTGTSIQVSINGFSEDYTVVLYGDVNGDGVIGLADMAAVKSHLLKINSLTGAFATAADLYAKGSVSLSDLLALKKLELGTGTINQNMTA